MNFPVRQGDLIEHEDDYSSASFPVPRDFQNSAHDKLRQGFKEGHRCQVIMSPTGSGKTYLGMRIIHEALRKGKSAVFVCDRTTLINQASEVASSYGLGQHSIIQSGHWRYDLRLPFQIASVQTLARRSWPYADVIVIDECHAQYAAWVEHIKKTQAAVIGLSATPFSKGLGKLFSNLVNAATMHELVQSGVLVPLRTYTCSKIDMEGAETSGGEWKESAAAERGIKIVGDVVAEWQKFAENRKTIVFGATIAHCESLCRQFNEAGILASTFTSETSDTERKTTLDEFKRHDSKIRVLISVEALAKGFDVKDVGCVCDCRPLRKSLSTAIQMWGRGLRSSPETGKQDCILLDFSGNFTRFIDDFTEIYYYGLNQLDAGEKLDREIRRDQKDKEPSQCPSCGFSPFGKICISCGHERQKKSLVEHLPGVMQEVVIGKSKLATSRLDLWQQICAYALDKSKPEKAPGRAWNLFKDITGSKSPFSWEEGLRANDVQITRATLNHIRRLNIAFAKRRAA